MGRYWKPSYPNAGRVIADYEGARSDLISLQATLKSNLDTVYYRVISQEYIYKSNCLEGDYFTTYSGKVDNWIEDVKIFYEKCVLALDTLDNRIGTLDGLIADWKIKATKGTWIDTGPI